MRLLKSSIVISLLLLGFLCVRGAMADWLFDATPPNIDATLTCVGGSAGSSVTECDSGTISVSGNFTDNVPLDSGLSTTRYWVIPTPQPDINVSGNYPTPVPTGPIGPFNVVIPNPPQYTYTFNATAEDAAGNGATEAQSIKFISSWYKLKNHSFHAIGSIPTVPATVQKFDATADDDTSAFLVIDTAGVVSSDTGVGSDRVSTDGWKRQAVYVRSTYTTPSVFEAYVKARKSYNAIDAITTPEDLEIGEINILNAALTIDATIGSTVVSRAPLVLIVKGDVTIDNNFNTGAASVAIISQGGAIKIKSTVNEIDGIFISEQAIDFAYDIAVGDPVVNQPLKVKGTLIAYSDSLSNFSKRDRSGGAGDSRQKPIMFIMAQPKMNVDLLSTLSVDTYDWKQLR